MRFRTLLLLAAFGPLLFAQEGPNTNPTSGPPMTAFTKRFFYDAAGNMQYICTARSQVSGSSTASITGATNATPIEITSVGHGLATDQTVTISGVGGNTAANGTWVITVTGADTFTLNSSVGAVNYTSGGTITTRAPRTSQSVWAVQKFTYGTSGVSVTGWANGSSTMTAICDNRASLGYQ